MNMREKPDTQSMQEEEMRKALDAHWRASASGDANAEHDIYETGFQTGST